ncbi:MAG TPA: FAD-dependent oxidoreductase [Galbitalea sp.]|jgi:2,4-dienoyl-CoA reductase (NADPH2)
MTYTMGTAPDAAIGDPLFEPITVGSRTLRNRIVFLPHATGLGDQGLPTDKHRAYYEARARGGAAMIVQESTPVHPTALGRPTHVQIFEERSVEPLSQIAAAVHDAGAQMLVQLSHRGLGAIPTFSGREIWSPSANVSPHTGEIAHAMSRSDIKEAVEYFRRSAANVAAAGYDGAEIHLAHGHLLHSFVSRSHNRRHDEYGGVLQNRLRFAVEVLEQVRGLGTLGMVGLRLSVSEWPLTDDGEIAQILATVEPMVDYISVTAGAQGTIGKQVADFFSPAGYLLEIVRAVKEHATKPIIAAGHLAEPSLARELISSGAADLVGIARGMIAEPAWAAKVRDGRDAEIRECVYCNLCLARVDAGTTIGCTVNPLTGREREFEIASSSGDGQRVLVVGAGPAGVEASLALAGLGCSVTLADRAPKPGGRVRTAAAVPGRGILHRIVDFGSAAIAAAGVNYLSGVDIADADQVVAEGYRGVVLATGAEQRDDAPFPSGVPVVSAESVVDRAVASAVSRALVVVDEGGAVGVGAAEVLAAAGVEVFIVAEKDAIGWSLPYANRASVVSRFVDNDRVALFVNTRVVAVGADGVVESKGLRPWIRPMSATVDLVVVAMPGVPRVTLAEQLAERGIPVVLAGDARAPRGIYEAAREGRDAASELVRRLDLTARSD